MMAEEAMKDESTRTPAEIEAASNAKKCRKAKRRVRATPPCSDKVWDIVDGQLVERTTPHPETAVSP